MRVSCSTLFTVFREPPPNQRLAEDESANVEHMTHSDEQDSNNFFTFPDLAEKYAKVMETIKECLNEVAIMRKKHAHSLQMQFNLMPLTATALDAAVAVNLDMAQQAASHQYTQQEHHTNQQMENK